MPELQHKGQREDILWGRCNGGVNFMLDWDKAGEYRFAALQSDAGKALLRRSGRREDDISSIVLVEPDASYIKSEAILRCDIKTPYRRVVPWVCNRVFRCARCAAFIVWTSIAQMVCGIDLMLHLCNLLKLHIVVVSAKHLGADRFIP